MCGIFGVLTTDKTLSAGQTAFIRAATVVGQVRGDDGTGWIVKASNSKPKTFKKALCGNDFLDTRIGRKGIKILSQAQVVIGHNRKTTSGGDSDSECHPYSYKHLVGVHNGGIPPVVLNRLDIKGFIADVDSAKLYAGLNAVENPIEVLEKIHTGAYALVWIDTRTNELCLARNGDRPLWASNSDGGMYFASEPGMLFWLMSRYNLESKDSKLMEIEESTLYRISLDNPSKVRRTPYTATPPVHKGYIPAGRVHENNRGKNAWFKNGDKKKAIAMYKYASTVADLIKQFPSLSFLGPIITDNLDEINTEYTIKGKPTRLDMIITHVKENNNGKSFPDVHGYMLDTTNSGIVIAIVMNSVKSDGFDFVKRFKKAERMNSHYTCRVHVTSIRTCADGTINIFANPITVWDHINNIAKDQLTLDAAIEVEQDVRERPSTLTDNDINTMWDKLAVKSVLTPDGKVVH